MLSVPDVVSWESRDPSYPASFHASWFLALCLNSTSNWLALALSSCVVLSETLDCRRRKSPDTALFVIISPQEAWDAGILAAPPSCSERLLEQNAKETQQLPNQKWQEQSQEEAKHQYLCRSLQKRERERERAGPHCWKCLLFKHVKERLRIYSYEILLMEKGLKNIDLISPGATEMRINNYMLRDYCELCKRKSGGGESLCHW